jgi:hypothetical protein
MYWLPLFSVRLALLNAPLASETLGLPPNPTWDRVPPCSNDSKKSVGMCPHWCFHQPKMTSMFLYPAG